MKKLLLQIMVGGCVALLTSCSILQGGSTAISHNPVAPQTHDIKLSGTHNRDTLRIEGLCNIIVTKREKQGNGLNRVEIGIENLDQNNLLCLFKESYTAKSLKNAQIQVDKGFGIEHVDAVSPKCQDDRYMISSFDGLRQVVLLSVDQETECRLPIYLVQKMKRNNLLHQVIPVTLNIKIESYDPDWHRLNAACEQLARKLDGKAFCTNSRHGKNQEIEKDGYTYLSNAKKHDYETEVQKLRKEIEATKERKFSQHSESNYGSLTERADSILSHAFFTSDCGAHAARPSTHQCEYDNLTAAEASRMAQQLFMQVQRGSIGKAEALRQAQAIDKCPKWKGDHASVRKAIERIRSLK